LAFFTFAERHKRIAFAPSLGTDTFPEDRIEEYKTWLNGFDKLSVREIRGAEIIKSITGRDAEVLVDPTMVLTQKDWDVIAERISLRDKYILIYTLGELTDEYYKYIQELSIQKKCQIVDIMRDKRFAGGNPSTFIGLIKNAEYVVTDSFHGSVFSLIYHRPLIILRRKGNENVMFSRLENLMHLCDLKPNNSNNERILPLCINWTYVDSIMERERGKSIEYLKSALKNI
jgi:hypothetical protein